MRSMTGYGSGMTEAPTHKLKLQVEITSVNRKTLDLNLSSPREWNGLDQKCNEWLKGKFERGRLNVAIKAQSIDSESNGPEWNEELMEQTLNRLKAFAVKNGVSLNADGSLILKIAQSIQEKAALPDWRELEEPLQKAFEQALNDLNSMREKEGQALQSDLQARVADMKTLRQEIAGHAEGTVASYRTALMERLNQLELELDASDERVLKEVALFADRCDISEEITRLGSHFEQFNELSRSKAGSGRKMDFLCQEIHREFNTIGSKANQIEITRAVIEGKNALERIREQVQNVE
ncbi:YicC family protein [Coraliomargarita sinensis]|uniref:YicC family protein n=1 Tax=Coraliomargarita sinensis TaxID=2174842 RepID=A0A317ZFH2_9BACT|nr:YicC/YloC family endoribonuclease [Coraliomargarita sinensis]PXA04314.1 YicC family protein [Coraliomargarita sinensis]